MQTKLDRDGETVVPAIRKRPRRMAVPGSRRRGYQAADLLQAMTVPAEAKRQRPRVEMPRVLIESFRVEGSDYLTARDHAVYMGLMAVARLRGMDADEHTVAASDLLKYLRMRSLDRLVESLRRTAKTFVTYDLVHDGRRKRSTFPMLIFDTTEPLKSGRSEVTFSIPFPVREAILTSLSYAMLEIAAFPLFKSRYTPRLYQRLALRAGYSTAYSAPDSWTVVPRELARELGWPGAGDRWHYATFRRDCLDPVLKDVAEHVTRFRVEVEETRGFGRGRPVERVTFHMTRPLRALQEAERRTMRGVPRAFLEMPDPVHSRGHLPSPEDLARAAGIVGRPVDEVSLAWRYALDRAKADGRELICGGRASGYSRKAVYGCALLATIREDGVKAGLEMWANALPFGCPIAAPPRHDAGRMLAPSPTRMPAPRHSPIPDWPDEEEALVDEHDIFDDLDDSEPPQSFYDDPQPTGEIVDDIPF